MHKGPMAFFAILICILLSSYEGKNIIFFAREAGQKEFKGALNIRIHGCGDSLFPPAELLLVDPQGRMTGYPPSQQETFIEIPYSSYEDESIEDVESATPGPVSKIIDVRNPPCSTIVCSCSCCDPRTTIRNPVRQRTFSLFPIPPESKAKTPNE